MKNPAASSGVSEKRELSVFVQLLINTPVLLNVVSYCGLIPMFIYCAGKIPIGPKLSSPQLFLDLGTQSEDLLRRYIFDDRYQLRHAVYWYRLHQKMYVILIRTYLQKLYLVSLLYLQTNIPHDLIPPTSNTALRYFAGNTM